VFLYQSDSTLSENIVTTNTADYAAGLLAVQRRHAERQHRRVQRHHQPGGGPVSELQQRHAERQHRYLQHAGFHGGGLFIEWQSAATLSGNTILSTPPTRRGVYLNYSNVTFRTTPYVQHRPRLGGRLNLGNDSHAKLNEDIVMFNAAAKGGGYTWRAAIPY